MRLASALLLISLPAAAWSEERARWSFGYSENEGLHKLVYGRPETEGDIYLRCIAGSDWVFLIHDYDPKPGKPPVKLRIGPSSITPSFRIEYDGVITDGFYVDMALPADHGVLDALADGHPLQFEGVVYPVETDVERKSIRNFISACKSNE